MTKIKQRVIGYLRVSTIDQNADKNKHGITVFANSKGLGHIPIEWVEEKVSGSQSWRNRKLAKYPTELKDGDVVIVAELSRLGRSLLDVLDVLAQFTKNGVKVYAVKENFQINGEDLMSKVLRTQLSMLAEIERDMIIMRVREGQAAAKAKGVRFGRPKGKGASKLDKHKSAIIDELKQGIPKKYIAQRYGCTPGNLFNWIKRNDLADVTIEL